MKKQHLIFLLFSLCLFSACSNGRTERFSSENNVAFFETNSETSGEYIHTNSEEEYWITAGGKPTTKTELQERFGEPDYILYRELPNTNIELFAFSPPLPMHPGDYQHPKSLLYVGLMNLSGEIVSMFRIINQELCITNIAELQLQEIFVDGEAYTAICVRYRGDVFYGKNVPGTCVALLDTDGKLSNDQDRKHADFFGVYVRKHDAYLHRIFF